MNGPALGKMTVLGNVHACTPAICARYRGTGK